MCKINFKISLNPFHRWIKISEFQIREFGCHADRLGWETDEFGRLGETNSGWAVGASWGGTPTAAKKC